MKNCKCSLQKVECYGMTASDAAAPMKLAHLYPNMLAYTAHLIHWCPETNTFNCILLKSQSRFSKLASVPLLEMAGFLLAIEASWDIFNEYNIPAGRRFHRGDSLVTACLCQKYSKSPQNIEIKFLRRLQKINNLGFKLQHYFHQERSKLLHCDLLTKAKECTAKNIHMFLGKFDENNLIYDLNTAFF